MRLTTSAGDVDDLVGIPPSNSRTYSPSSHTTACMRTAWRVLCLLARARDKQHCAVPGRGKGAP